MERNIHPRVIGACVIGFALVAGAYVLSNFGQSNFQNQQVAAINNANTERVAIAVTDNDNNGVEDWRDEFITTEPIIVDTSEDEPYQAPTTLTGQIGVDLIGDYLGSKIYGPFGSSQEEIIAEAVDRLQKEGVYELYDTPDITIMSDSDEQTILTYANTVALAITNNDPRFGVTEIDILSKTLRTADPDPEAFAQVTRLADAYQAMRDDVLATPVPASFVKQHLDLANTLHALHQDVLAMAESQNDSLIALVRLRRYQDDTTGLRLALQNMYAALEPYASLVGPSDPALLFVTFSPEFTS